MTVGAPLLETQALTKRFGGVLAIDRIDFSVEPRELRCVIGPNGAGKSSFFKCLTGLARATSGRVLFMGQDITRADPCHIARLGIATKTQVPNVFDGLSVRENIWIAANRHSISGVQAMKASENTIQRLGLSTAANAVVGQLAHGARQWVELAMIVVANPKLVLLDEPTAGMSGAEIFRVEKLLNELKSTATIIVVEHDVKFIRRIASHVTVLHNGSILIEGPVATVLSDTRVRDVYLGRHSVT